MKDNGGKRRLADRRRYSDRFHFPACLGIRFRRSGQDRRKQSGPIVAVGLERRQALIQPVEETA